MSVKGRVASVLIGAAISAAFAGAWLTWALGVALLVVAAIVLALGLLLAMTDTAQTIEDVELETVDDAGEPVAQGKPPRVMRIATSHPFFIAPPEPRADETVTTNGAS